MNCYRVEELLPLYVESDLDADVLRKVSAHLGECERCAKLAAEFNESQAWLHGQTLPDFDERFYVDLQRNVMRQIEDQQPRFSFRQMLVGIFMQKPIWAAAIALLLLGGLAIYSYQLREQNIVWQFAAEPDKNVSPLALQRMPDVNRQTTKVVNDSSNREERNPQAIHYVIHHRHRKQPSGKIPEKSTDPTYIADSSNQSYVTSETISTPTHMEMTRIEFQTSDPKIRIIWFVPKTTEATKEIPKIETE